MLFNVEKIVKHKALIHTIGFNEGSPPSGNEIGGTSARVYDYWLPKILQTTAPAVNSYMQATSPAQQQLQAQLFAGYAPILNQIGQGMAASNAQAQSQSDANIVNGTGKQVVSGVNALQQSLDPQFYGLRDQINNGVSSLLSSLGNPNQLSGSESAEIERNLNRSNYNAGNAFVGNPLTTIQNAMTFGQGLQQRQGFNMGMQQAASSIAPNLKSGMDAFQMTTGKPSVTQFGSNQLTGANAGNANDLSNNLLTGAFGGTNNAAQLQQAQNANNSIQGINKSMPSY